MQAPHPPSDSLDAIFGADMGLQASDTYQAHLATLELSRERMRYWLRLAKQTTWLALLSGSYLIFYLLSVIEQCFQLAGF